MGRDLFVHVAKSLEKSTVSPAGKLQRSASPVRERDNLGAQNARAHAHAQALDLIVEETTRRLQ